MKNQKGFTLIEIGVVVAIIGILGAIAVPQYKQYMLKSKFAEVINQTSAIKQSVSLCLREYKQQIGCSGGINNVLTDITAINKTKYTLNVITQDGVITATARGPDDSIAIAAAGGTQSTVACSQNRCAAPIFNLVNGAYQVNCPPAAPGLTYGGYYVDWIDYWAGNRGGITMFLGSSPYSCYYSGTPAPTLLPTGLLNQTYILTPIVNSDTQINWKVSGSCIAANLCE